MGNNNKKKQHFVNQAYLKLFSIPDQKGKIWCYSKLSQFEPRSVSVQSIAYRSYYYSQTNPDGSKHNQLEDVISEIESEVTTIIQSLKLEKGANFLSISHEDKSLLALYMALMFYRNPMFRDGVHNIYEKTLLQAMTVLIHKKLMPQLPIESLNIKISDEVSLRPMILGMESLARCLLGKYWQFNFSESYDFITGDTPVVMDNIYSSDSNRPGSNDPFTEFMFPLRPDLCLVCTYTNPVPEKNNLVFLADQKFVDKCNIGIIRAAQREIYANVKSEKLLELTLENQSYRQGIEVL